MVTKRKCDKCGKIISTRDFKICERGHYICKSCDRDHVVGFTKKWCPVCKKAKLR